MHQIYTTLHKISRFSVWVFGAGFLVIAFLTTADVFLRNTVSVTLIGAEEISGYVFAIATTWGYAYCLFERSHVRIDAAYSHFSTRLRSGLDVLGLLALGLFVGMLTWRAWGTLDETLLFQSTSLTPLQTPIWIPQSLWFAGFVFFFASIVFITLYVVVLLMRGDHAGLREIAGIAHVDEEILEYTDQSKGKGAP